MVELARAGVPLREVGRRSGVALRTVQRWVARAADTPLDEVDWSGRSRAPHRTRQVRSEIEDEVIRVRRELRASLLGDHGAMAIREALVGSPSVGDRVPSVRTIGRILDRRGALDGRRRERRPAPPRGWYLPDVVAKSAELDSFDVIEDRHIAGAGVIEVLTGMSLHGGLAAAWPAPPWHGQEIARQLVDHWAAVGRPAYAQFDNDTRFHGSHAYPDVVGPVVRLCLALSIVPVFAPSHEQGFQAAIERFNGLWQERVWKREQHTSVSSVCALSERFIDAHRARHAPRIELAPDRPSIPVAATVPVPMRGMPSSGRMVFLRRTSDTGRAIVLGRPYEVGWSWPHRLVRAELDLDARELAFYALRRREPTHQPLLAIHPYEPTRRQTHPRDRTRE